MQLRECGDIRFCKGMCQWSKVDQGEMELISDHGEERCSGG